MLLRLSESPVIDNLQNYPAETVEKLRSLLTAGAIVVPDPRRKNFYDVQNGEHVYYVHVTPSGRVLFLAVWRRECAAHAA